MRRLCLFTSGFALAAAMCVWLLRDAPWWLALPPAGICAALFFLRTKAARRMAIAVLGLLAGFVWCRGYEALFVRPLTLYSGLAADITAQVQTAPQQTAYGYAVLAQLQLDGRRCQAAIYYTQADAQPEPGDMICGTAKLTAAQKKLSDSGAYELSRGILMTASCRDTLQVIKQNGGARFWPARLAERLRQSIQAAFPRDTAGFMQALLLGDKSGLTYAEKNNLALAGIYHAVAVSGMHVSILLGVILLFCGANRRLAAALGIPMIAFFIVMTGAPASAVRAGIMQAMVLLAPLAGRENDPPTTICAALLVLLAQNPWSILDVGLQLSFASTAGIVLFAGRIYRALTAGKRMQKLLRRRISWVLRAMVTALCCTISSMVFALPVTALQFRELSLAAPATNVLCLWILSVVFCCGMAAAIAGLFFAPAAAAAAWVLSWPVRWVLLVVRAAAGIPFAAIYLENGYMLVAATAIYAFALLLAIWPGRRRTGCAAVAAAAVLTCCLGLARADWLWPQAGFTMLDVGQGQCLISRNGNSVTVIDCGGQTEESGECAARYLLSVGQTTIDRLILTHFDADHCNGVPQLLRRLRVQTLYVPQLQGDSALQTQILAAAALSGTAVCIVTQDIELPEESGGITIFAPVGDSGTNTGLCVLAGCEKYDILITGDLPDQAEYRLLSTHALPEVTALVAGHHGSASSTSQTLLQTLQPQVVLISVGQDNPFGHPDDAVLARIRQSGAEIYRTDQCGSITILAR